MNNNIEREQKLSIHLASDLIDRIRIFAKRNPSLDNDQTFDIMSNAIVIFMANTIYQSFKPDAREDMINHIKNLLWDSIELLNRRFENENH